MRTRNTEEFLTHSDFDGVLVANKADFRRPRSSGDDSCNEYIAFVVGSIRSSYMGSIGGPATKRIMRQLSTSSSIVHKTRDLPETSEERSRRVLKWFLYLRLQLPVFGPPNFDCSIVGTRC